MKLSIQYNEYLVSTIDIDGISTYSAEYASMHFQLFGVKVARHISGYIN